MRCWDESCLQRQRIELFDLMLYSAAIDAKLFLGGLPPMELLDSKPWGLCMVRAGMIRDACSRIPNTSGRSIVNPPSPGIRHLAALSSCTQRKLHDDQTSRDMVGRWISFTFMHFHNFPYAPPRLLVYSATQLMSHFVSLACPPFTCCELFLYSIHIFDLSTMFLHW